MSRATAEESRSPCVGLSGEQLLESCPDGFIAFDARWRITFVNSATERINGQRREELLGRNHWELYPAAVGTVLHERLQRVMTERVPLRIENYYEPWDRWFELDAFPTPDGGVAAYYRDITERKAAEEQLRKKQAELSDFVENAVVGLHWVGPDGTILWANQAELDLLGYTREEYVGHKITEFHADAGTIQNILCRLTNGEELHACEARLRCKDGSIRHVMISSNVYRENGEFRHTRCFTRDITDRKRAEDALRLSEERFRAAAAATSDIVWTNDPTGRMTADQPGWAAFTGQCPDQYQGHGWAAAVHPDDAAPTLEAWKAAVAERRPFVYEHRVRRNDGVYRTFSVRAVPVLDADGSVREWVGTHADITERKRSEAQLLDIRDRLEAALEAATVGIWSWDVKKDRLSGDRNFARIFSLPTGEVAGGLPLVRYASLIHPDDKDRVVALVEEAVASGGRYAADYRVVSSDGEVRWVEVRGRVYLDSSGKPDRFPGIVSDITERKRIEAELERVSAESERRRRLYETILSNTPDLAYVWGLDHRFVYANEVLLRLWGKSRDEAIGRTCLELGYEPWHAEMHDREIEQVKATKQPVRGEVPFTGTFGPRVYDYILVPVFGDDGEVEAVAGTTRDVTERKQVEESLRESQRRLSTLLSNLPGMAYRCPTELPWPLTFVSEGVGPLAGRTPEEFLECRLAWAELVHPEDADAVQKEVEAALREHRVFTTIYRIFHSSGEVRWVLDRGQPIYDAAGAPIAFEGFVSDLTDKMRAEEALRDADRRKDQFLATLAHELRNPLAPISNALQVWPLVEKTPAEADRVREMMGRQVSQLTRLIDDLLDVSRISRGKIELRLERLDLATAVEGAVESVRPFIEAHGHSIEIILPAEPVTVDGDVGRLVQVFGNLLNNAAKYTLRGGRISVRAGLEADRAVVRVRDNGLGIPTEMLSSIFEMFTQVDQTLHRSQGGLGIGLTLVKNLVELHGGTIEALSDGPGRGSEFIVRLPIVIAAKLPDLRLPAALPRDHSLLPTRRVLVVDDVKPSANTLAMMLKGLHQDARAAYDGPSALAMISDFRPDVAFLDIAMPGMDGYELARRIRAMADSKLMLVALTGYGQAEDRRRAFDAGFNHHLVKPTSIDSLRELLMTVTPPIPDDV